MPEKEIKRGDNVVVRNRYEIKDDATGEKHIKTFHWEATVKDIKEGQNGPHYLVTDRHGAVMWRGASEVCVKL